MSIRRLALAFSTLLAVACSGATGLPSALDGTWQHRDVAFASTLTLSVEDNAISGTGQWSGEACCAGTVAVTGTVEGNIVTLDQVFTATSGALPLPPFTQHFVGTLDGHDLLTGTATGGGQTAAFTYQRTE